MLRALSRDNLAPDTVIETMNAEAVCKTATWVRSCDNGSQVSAGPGATRRPALPAVRWHAALWMATTMSLAMIVCTMPARADDIRDALIEAQKAYSAGDLAAAKQALDAASQLLAQKSADGLSRFLPASLPGWTAEAIETDSSAAAMFGGGLIAKRTFNRGSTDLTIQILSQSPFLMQVSGLFGNAQMLGSMGRVFRTRGKTAVMTREGAIQVLLGKSFITIEGSASEADKRAALDKLDLAAIEAFGT